MLPGIIVFVIDSLDATRDVAAAWAVSLARSYDSDLHVVHVHPGRRTRAVEGAHREELVARINRIVEASGATRARVTPAVLSGRPVRAIADYARHVAADLVVVSNRPRRRSGYWCAGSFAAALGKAVTSPTIVVPGTVAQPVSMGWPFRNIVAGVDFSDASFRALSESLNLAQRGAGRLRIVHVMRGFPFETVYGGTAALRLRAHLGATATRINRELRHLVPSEARHWSEITTTTVAGDAPEGILASASRARADLIVLGLPRRSRLEDFLAGSTVHRVVRRTTVPVLLVPGPATPPSVLLAEDRGLRLAPSVFGERGLDGKDVAISWR